jgi:uncharacterized RDD family membrane protein YckC/predicted nucleic acid-binding Zn ribbon protein
VRVDGSGAAWSLVVGPRRVALPEGEHVVGRSRDCDVVVRDATVSRAHALVAVTGGRVTVQDLGSSNGTLVNGQRVHEETELGDGDQVRLGRVRMTLLRGGVAVGGAAGRAGAAGVAACPSCAAPVEPGASLCGRCGEPLSGERRLSRSEAVAMSEVMAVGETLARPARSLDETLPPFPAPWIERRAAPAAEEAAGDETGDGLAGAARASDEPPPEALEDASSPVAVARAAEEDSPPPRPPGAAASEVEDSPDDDEPRAAGEGIEGDAAHAPLFLPAAGFWVRAAAFAIDLAAPLALGIVVGVAVSGWTRPAGLAAGLGVGLLAWLAVSVPGWRRRGDSPGKRLLGLRVCDLDGRPGIGGGRALARFGGYLVGVATLGVGFLVAGLSAGRRGLHDRLAGTYVGRLQDASRDVARRST